MLQDTPGLASSQVHKAICKHVAAQDQAYLRHIQDPRKHCFKTDNIDPRVDVCLIFLNPHAVSAQEVKLMQGMGKLCVPVIPLIAKVRCCSCTCTVSPLSDPGNVTSYGIAPYHMTHQHVTDIR